MTAIRSVVLGCGSYLPERVLTNAELAQRIDTSDDWIVQRTGIMGGPMARHLAAAGHSLTVYNRTRAKAEAWVDAHGGAVAESPAAAAAGKERCSA